ncbi:class I SAM-dependent methyltransferase [Thermophilibacter sp.]
MTPEVEVALKAAGLELRRADGGALVLAGDGMELRADLSSMVPRLRPDRLGRELLVRAARVRGAGAPTAVDATAGLGEDALLLAAAGFSVTLYERDPVIAALLADALARAADDPALTDAVGRMRLIEGDSIAGLHAMGERGEHPDVVFLDPMFPERRKSAAVRKKFQLLHHLERPCDDEQALLDAALAACPRKVVIKRPPKGPRLAGAKPSYELAGKAVRYDVIVPPRA